MHESRELGRSSTDGLLRGFQQVLTNVLLVERLADLRIELGDDRGRRPGRNENAEPLVEHQALDACFLIGWHVRQARRARLCALRENANRAGLVMRHQWRRPERSHLDMAANEIVDRLSAAAVGHVLQLDACELGKPFRHNLLLRADPGGRKAHAGLALGQRDEFRQRVHAERGMYRQHDRLARQLDHWHQGLHRVDVHLEDVGRARHEVGRDQDRVAIGRSVRGSLNADDATGAGLVLDNGLLAQGSAERFADQARGINLADITNDGITDIVIGGGTSNNGEIIVLIGNGDGTFQSPIISTVTHAGSNGGTPYLNAVMGIGDINGDGAADLIIADPTSATLYLLSGDNKGHFAIGNTITFYFTGESDTYLFDLNGDGHLDVVVNNLLGAQTIVWLGNGDGTLQPGVRYTSYAVAFADLDGDGHPDLVGEIYPGQVQVLKGNPDGTFGSPAVVTTVPAGDFLLAAGNFNGDGIADMLFMTPAGIGVVLGKGNLTYGSIVSSIAGTLASSYLHGSVERDFNGDGHLDVAMAVSGGLLVLLGNGDGTFASGDSYDVGHAVGAVAVADFNGDKFPDIAASVSATYPRLLLGNSAGRFTLGPDQNQSYGSQPPSGSVTAADFNGDKKNDLYMLEDTQAYPYGQPFLLLGVGNGTFASPTSIDSGPTLIGDLNGDGRSDMVTLSNGSIVAMLGQTNGTFQQVLTTLTEPSGMAALGDVNHDGKLDLLTFEYPAIRVWLGNGNGSFTQSSLLSAPPEQLNFQSVAVADLDGDGNADIVVVSYPNQIGAPYPLLIYYGNGDGTFQDGVAVTDISLLHTVSTC